MRSCQLARMIGLTGLVMSCAPTARVEPAPTARVEPAADEALPDRVAIEAQGGAVYIKVAPRRFTMGSSPQDPEHQEDEAQVEVQVTRAFLIKATEVTQQEWEAVMGHHPSQHQACAQRPVESVSWYDALGYLNKLSQAEGLERCDELDGQRVTWLKGLDCRGYRLPTEAEWELAAAAASQTPASQLEQIAWWSDNSEGKTHPVAQKQPDAAGLYDMFGNLSEWTWDLYAPALPGGTDPMVGGLAHDGSDEPRVARGCGWASGAPHCRAAQRVWSRPSRPMPFIGVRPVRSSP